MDLTETITCKQSEYTKSNFTYSKNVDITYSNRNCYYTKLQLKMKKMNGITNNIYISSTSLMFDSGITLLSPCPPSFPSSSSF